MIIKDTIFSIFNEKGTLLEYLKKVEKEVVNTSIDSIYVNKTAENKAIMTIFLSNGTHISSGEFTLPKGADGKDGTDGQDGKDGQDGQDGKDGKDGFNPLNINPSVLYITNNTSTDLNFIPVRQTDAEGHIIDTTINVLQGETKTFSSVLMVGIGSLYNVTLNSGKIMSILDSNIEKSIISIESKINNVSSTIMYNYCFTGETTDITISE